MGKVIKFPKSTKEVCDLGVEAPILPFHAPNQKALAVRETESFGSDAAAWARAEYLYERGYDFEEAGDATAALASYQAAIAIKPLYADAHVNAGRIEHEAGNLESALDHYTAAVAGAAHNATAMFNLGVVLEDLGHTDRARGAYLSATKLDPKNADAHYNLARILEALGDSQAAIRHLKEYRKLTGKSA